ncbi:hypothetical protein TA3x_002795 [Tundrisphaera sp. TA3]|uniref:hypothetical protein n=1 Tax=Tundrisphaera sp. TA3 TaxID=3435775 RepID=UPI003EBF8169
MSSPPARPSGRIDPAPAWTIVTDAPLKGLGLAREAGCVLAWDEADQLYRIDGRGQFQSVARAPGKVSQVAISDDGTLVAILGEGSRLWLLDGDFNLLHDRPAISDPLSLAVDPHGRYVAVGSRMNLVQITDRRGKAAGRFETRQPLSNIVFVPTHPFLIGTGAFGSIMGIALAPRGGSGGLDGNVFWYEALMTSVGQLSTSGDGGMILIACFTHGVQKYNLAGHAEGSYHLGGSASHAMPDFAGRSIAVATLEGELAILSGAGNVRWRTTLPRPASALQMDALGRYVIYGMASGEVVRLDLQGAGRSAASAPPVGVKGVVTSRPEPEPAPARMREGAAEVRTPDWAVEVVQNEDQAEFAVLAVADQPPRVGVITHHNRLELFGTDGRKLGQAPEIDGVGRILRVAPNWMAAATDRRIILCDLANNTARRVDMSLAELTHLAILPDSYGLGLVQERDRVGRATIAGRWIWKAELKSPVEELAITEEGYTAMTTEDGKLRVHDPAGVAVGESQGAVGDPALLFAAPAGAGVTWITLSRRSQVIRGHDREGQVLWQSPVPWEGWQLHSVGPLAVVVAPDGRTAAYDATGRVIAQGRADGPPDAFLSGPGGKALRIVRQGVHLLCSDLGGRVIWRAVAEAPLGPIASDTPGVAAMVGKTLAWFGSRQNP